MNEFVVDEKYLDRYADLLVAGMKESRLRISKKFGGKPAQAGDIIRLFYQPLATLLAQKVYAKLLREGFIVVLRPQAESIFSDIFYQEANQQQLTFEPPWELDLSRRLNGSIYLYAYDDLFSLKNCDPAKIAIAASSMLSLRKAREERITAGLFGWSVCVMPTEALAEQAGISLQEYWREVIKACHLDTDNPVEFFYQIVKESSIICNWLSNLPIDYVHIFSESRETDLKVWIGQQRQWLGADGCNIPSFEIFVSPQAGKAEGVFYANEPSFRSGRLIRDVRLQFKDGKVIKVTAGAEEDFVKSRVYLDEGSAMIGEFSLTDRRFSHLERFMAHTMYDENRGGRNGNCHIAIGDSFPDCYAGSEKFTPELQKELGFNKSAEHWDMVNTESKTVVAHLHDGTEIVIYKDGMFTME